MIIIIIICVIALLILSLFIAKRILIKMLKTQYEKSLIKGDKVRSMQVGKSYYLSLNKEYRKTKGIIDIETKIFNDFRSFNESNSSVLL